MTLKQLRESLGLTQIQVAERMGTTQSEISKIEKRKNMRASTLRKYIAALGGEISFEAVFKDTRFVLRTGKD